MTQKEVTPQELRYFIRLIGGAGNGEQITFDHDTMTAGNYKKWSFSDGFFIYVNFTARLTSPDHLVLTLDNQGQTATLKKPIKSINVGHVMRAVYAMTQAALIGDQVGWHGVDVVGRDLLPLDQQETWGVFGG